MISLVVSTMGRVTEIGALFDSLLADQGTPFEVILVDQNADRRLDGLVAQYAPRLALRHLRSAEHGAGNGANAGRNLGLRHALGDIVGFPDDDCVFPAGVLAKVRATFDADPRLAILTGPAAAPEGGLGSGRWNPESGVITLGNVWTSVIEFNLWLGRPLALALGGFDEAMGPGARFGSAEGNDLVCRAMARGHVARYDVNLRIIHPDKRLTPEAVARAGRYGLGLGFALRRHHAPIGTWAPLLYRPLAGIGVSLLRGRMLHARYYAATFQGRLAGFLAPEARSLPEPTALDCAA
ncbi:glycosyltransferase [Roseococcus sp. SDR]|uniref:glycosyltransferase family 2 protein n=1 Tax=Roseococcus sp. SDR TaxID=2835532 RepID=UPI001BCAFC8D|nr:glycosyltransferase family 2 protein [Roseococcus sp. SDR]MBS7788373.1 glycosyltransferase [Roseococcus sp. SDR]MBV1843687.1 glycosyltransferase [Roseococcus sp. SDR]